MRGFVFTYYFTVVFLFSGVEKAFSQDPVSPVIKFVTVDKTTSDVTISWEKSPSPNVLGYIIYREVKTVNGYEGDSIDFVAASVDSYLHQNGGIANHQSVLYSVCTVGSDLKYSSPRASMHGTIFSSVTYDSCYSTLTLRWNKYTGWGNNVSGYRLYKGEEGNTPEVIAGINSADSSYIIYGIKENTNYNFYVEGVKNDNTVSSSNLVSKYTFMPAPPDELLLDYVSVISSSEVDASFRFSSATQISNFALLRSNQEFSEFDKVKTFTDVLSSPFTVKDSVFTSVTSYFYRVAAINTCGTVIGTSNLGTNILLQGNNVGNTNLLEWTEYRDFPAGISSYEVYRADPSGNMEMIGSSQLQTSFIDDLSRISGQNYTGKISYQIKAIENGNSNASFSNILAVKTKSDVWMPNAFTPNGDGINDVFLPLLSFIPDDFLMIIYDRSGASVFVSKNPENGWDGRINGKQPAPEGVYTYHVQFSSLNGQKDSKTGHVTVFYPR